jgi:hypothetical protein
MENYKTIEGYENYEVSDLGNVRNIKTGKILKPQFSNGQPYRCVTISNGKSKPFAVHILVAMAFLGHVPNGKKAESIVVDHIDNDKSNNQRNNLQLVTNRYNLTKNKTSPYPTGVKKTLFNKYNATIRINGKQTHIGNYTTIEEASEAYQTKLKEIT